MKKKSGPKSKYNQEQHDQLGFFMARAGLTDEEMAMEIGISRSTLSQWKIDHPSFAMALSFAKKIADEEVVRALYEKATGYSCKAVKIVADAKTGTEHIVHYTEHYPPDTTACIFWLKNRQSDRWRDKQQHEVTGKDGRPIEHKNIHELSRDELMKIAAGDDN